LGAIPRQIAGVFFAYSARDAPHTRAQLPAGRVTKAELVWLSFVAVQAMDGIMSYVGVNTFGSWIEANPLVAWYASAFGPAVAFAVVKLFAIAVRDGALSDVPAPDRGGADAVLPAFAVVPWAHVLHSYTNI
jgi:uncharacterized membrane protein